ncbi:MAG TPA: hypothetical protein VFA56_01730 [Gaiellaceae bacterium]|nr:hypothetical protein [Gaiellaceae bacterium]
MRRLRTLLAQEDGIAMLMVLGITILLSVLAVVFLDVMNGEAARSKTQVTRETAYQAAEAGIDEYISKLVDDRLYYVHFVHPGESTRQSASSGRILGAGQTWQQTDGGSWTYPRGKDTWFGAAKLGNAFEYNLEVFPPTSSQPLIRILSTARPVGDADVRDWRELEVLVRPSSLSDFQMFAAADISYGSTATTYGKIYAGIDNSGNPHSVNHDGTAYGDIYAENRITGATSLQGGAQKYSSTTTPSVRVPIKTPVRFSSFLASLVDIRNAAGAGGVLQDNTSVDAWWLTFQANGQVLVQSCTKNAGKPIGDAKPTCGAATALTLPANGAIYVGQPVIVSGTVNGRVTIGGASDIYVGGNISYQTDGDDVLGLVASRSVIVPQWAPSTLTWRAATIAQSGTWRSYGFDPQTGQSEQDYIGNFRLSSMTFTGSTATYGGGSMSLFATRVYQYDQTLLYLPPPWFPTVQDAYTIVLEREVAASAS